ncbi:M23 family metallopeptidase [Eoetvoesiella caeni]|uniref:Murein DD-endopeptidase MepM/ murein hydrolase activator NlpD n=1 Tax=Eoetvoesiella caeni TaxID=645616 RepID=A0A366HA53_9BURK|nr:M23 family metallopeptidase [Eoetvoesiella caeni]MCI2809478.1 M23 family metallopeptidase [Eoetvoesiella caeni]RBP38737.1 murein DD-endopeptidase MepM/ murein hydrolase activator NlpD [Eoetvoesiella caeni]
MRIVFSKGPSGDSSAKGLKLSLAAVFAIAGLGAAAAAGAWVQGRVSQPATLSVVQEQAINDLATRDSNYIRGNVDLLASKVGDLQARLIELEGLSKRVAKVAGLSYTDPEIQAGIVDASAQVMDYITPDDAAFGSAEGLGRELDSLQQQAARQKDRLAMLDVALTRRAGVEASLPTYTPVNYPYLSSSFGWRRNPVTGRHVMHEGLDFAAPRGTPIRAASGGVVTEARSISGYGKMVEITHGNGLVTRYAHASKLNVAVGDIVEKGQLIANVGSTGRSTGPHLHFEVRMAGHPLDPTLFLAKQEAPPSMVVDASKQVEAILPEVR